MSAGAQQAETSWALVAAVSLHGPAAGAAFERFTREGPLDSLTVAVDAREGVVQEGSAARAAAERLAHEIKTYIGTSARIEVRPAGGVERSLGKARRVLDLRKS